MLPGFISKKLSEYNMKQYHSTATILEISWLFSLFSYFSQNYHSVFSTVQDGILLFGAGPSKLETEGHKNNRVITANLHCTKAQTVIWWNEHRFLSPVRLWRQNYNSGRRWWAKNVFNQLHKVEMAKMIDTKSALNSILCLAPW